MLLAAVFSMVRAYLPNTWSMRVISEVGGNRTQQPEALWEIQGPDGTVATMAVEVTRRVEPRQVALIVNRLTSGGEFDRPLVVSSFLGPRTRELLENSDICYADATGNLRLHLETPALFVRMEGAAADPWRSRGSVRSLKGPAAGRVVRALCDFQPPYRILELAERSDTPASSVSRIIDLLDHEALLRRIPRGAVLEAKVPDLIRRWTQDYGLSRSNTVSALLEPRGLDALLRKLTAADWPYAVTGSLAAKTIAPYAGARLGVVYVRSIEQATGRLGLRAVEAGTNVLLVEPFDSVVFDRVTRQDDVIYAAISQVAADLLTSPGRGPAEGEELLRWMEEHEYDWRH